MIPNTILDNLKPTTRTVPFGVFIGGVVALLAYPFLMRYAKQFLTPAELADYASMFRTFFASIGGIGGLFAMFNSTAKTQGKVAVQKAQAFAGIVGAPAAAEEFDGGYDDDGTPSE